MAASTEGSRKIGHSEGQVQCDLIYLKEPGSHIVTISIQEATETRGEAKEEKQQIPIISSIYT